MSAPEKCPTLVQENVGREGLENRTWEEKCENLACLLSVEDRICRTQEVNLVEFKTRSRSWKLGANGLHRNVYKSVKTFRCPAKPGLVNKNLSKPSNWGTKINSSPTGLFKIFEKRKRKYVFKPADYVAGNDQY